MAYKYRNVADKTVLIENLNKLAQYITTLGHQVFILGRDIQNWNSTTPVWRTIPHIFLNMRKCDVVFVFIDNSTVSIGLPFEIIIAKILNKKIIMAVKKDISGESLCSKADQVVIFNDLPDLETKISTSNLIN